MKKYVLMFLMALSAGAWADDKQGQTNVYDVFRQFTVDEETTAAIKRRMATLLYPVDMSSFVGPEKDGKFGDLIKALQKQMGAPATGVLTFDQFNRLAEASHDIDDPGVWLGGKKNFYSDGAGISVTGTMDGYLDPLNMARIFCWKPHNTCDFTIASFDEKGNLLHRDVTDTYEIKTWTQDRVTTIKERPCGTITMTVDVKAEALNIVRTPRTPGCFGSGPNVWTLVDGFNVAWKLHLDRIGKARALIYEPARNLMPGR
jgi:hypothetical protein